MADVLEKYDVQARLERMTKRELIGVVNGLAQELRYDRSHMMMRWNDEVGYVPCTTANFIAQEAGFSDPPHVYDEDGE